MNGEYTRESPLQKGKILWYTYSMRLHPFYSRALRTTSLLLAALLAMIIAIAFWQTLDTVPITGQVLTPPVRAVPSRKISEEEMSAGTTIPPDTHVTFTLPLSMPSITRITLFGGPNTDTERYWGYCFLGDEKVRKASGMKPYHETGFFYSSGQQRENASLTSLHEIFRGGETCYVMSSVPLGAGPDEDGDLLNASLERIYQLDEHNPDSDFDGIADGREVFDTKTNPSTNDTDSDGLIDSLEDKNQNGIRDEGETNPLNADSDNDGLCDGDGDESGCKEAARIKVTKNCPDSVPASECRLLAHIRGEDMNKNGIVDPEETSPTTPYTFEINGEKITDWQYRRLQLKDSENIRTP